MSAVRRVINDTATTSHKAPQYQMQKQTTQPLPRYSQYTVRLMARSPLLAYSGLRNSSSVTYFGNRRIYELQPAETESAPNVIRLLSAETECPPKVPIYPYSAPKPKPKPNFGRPLVVTKPRSDYMCVGERLDKFKQ